MQTLTLKDWIGYFLFAIPVLHLMAAALYLYGYCAGFGANVAALVSVEDIFRVTINDLVDVYIVALFVPLLFVLWRFTWKHPYAADKVAAIQDDQKRLVANKRLVRDRNVGLAGIATIALAVIVKSILILVESDIFLFKIIWLPLVMLIGVVVFSANRSWLIHHIVIETLVLTLMFLGSALFYGLGDGQFDRHMKFSFASSSNISCRGSSVIRPLGNHELVVGPNESKAVVDSSCAIRYSIPKATDYVWPWELN